MAACSQLLVFSARLLPLACLGLLLLLVLQPQEVTSFSVGGRAARRRLSSKELDLAEALALLQRERRRVSQAYLDPDSLLDGVPLTAADVSDWLREARDNNIMLDDDMNSYLDAQQEEPTWMSDGNFKGFAATQPLAVKPSKAEIESIFSDDDEPQNEPEREIEEEKSIVGDSKKKKRGSSQSNRKLVKKSVYTPYSASAGDTGGFGDSSQSSEESSNLSLATLTQEEFKALMKAVGKLKKQVAAKDGALAAEAETAVAEITQPEPGEEMAIVQPASKEELQSLFSKEDDDVEGADGASDSELLPESNVVMEEEVYTPEGGSKMLEVDTPEGGRRITELDTADGQKQVVEETLPEESMENLQEALEDSERELTDALASRLEEDISQEAVKEELEAEEEAEEKAAEEAAEEVAAAQESSQQQQSEEDEAVAAAKEEIVREIGANNLAALEKIWMSQNDPLSPFPEKRTTKRAAGSSYNGQYRPAGPRGIPDLTLERLLSNSDIVDDRISDEDIIDSIDEGVKEAALERELLDEKNALASLTNGKVKEDIMYGSPLNGDEYEGPDSDDIVFDVVSGDPDPPVLPPVTSPSITSSSNRVSKERLRELASALSPGAFEDVDMESADENSLDSIGEPHLPKEVAGLPPPLGQFVTRIVELQDEVSQLRVIAQLADLENDVLTDALNEATMAQAPGTVSDMEFESLQQAIWVEKKLQKLKNGGSISDLSVLSQPGSLGSTGSVKLAPSKKGEPWRRKRGKVAALADDTAVQTLPLSAPLDRSSRPVSKAAMERLLGEAYLRKGTLPDLVDMDLEEASVASIFLPNAEECPAVREYSTNCELADLYSLPVDYEARALCNLHEMCYACGHSLHVDQASCDEVYRDAANALCRKGSVCTLEAEIFLRTMKLKTRYVPHSQPACRSACTAQFLGMF